MSKTTKRQPSQPSGGFVSRTSILSHVARYDRSNLEDENTLVLSYRSIGPEVTTLKQLGPKKRLTGVQTIFLDHNSLRKFEPAERLSGVKELYLDHNYLKEVAYHPRVHLQHNNQTPNPTSALNFRALLDQWNQ